MKMTMLTMGLHTDFKQWNKRNFLTVLYLNATHVIPHRAIRESGVWMAEAAQNHAFVLLLQAATEKRIDHEVKCASASRHDCDVAAWDIMCERLDGRSFSRSMSLLDNYMVRLRLGLFP
jgi:hypothetical protein